MKSYTLLNKCGQFDGIIKKFGLTVTLHGFTVLHLLELYVYSLWKICNQN